MLADQDEAIRQQLREQSLRSLYFFGKAIIGYKDFTPELHLPVCDFVQDWEIRKKGLLMPRGHFKTSLATISYPIWLYLHDHNRRILIANETTYNAEKFLGKIKSVFENNRYFQWLFPEAIPNFSNQRELKRWNNQEILLPRKEDYPECTISTVGAGCAVTSRHFTDIILDDLIGFAAASSQAEMEKAIDWHKYIESLLEDSSRDRTLLVGTRWGFHDLYEHLQKYDYEYVWYIKECYEDGKPIFPQRFSEKTLEKILHKQGHYIFSCQYLNNPSDPDLSDFQPEWLQFYKVNDDGSLTLGNGELVKRENLYTVMTIDPAATNPRRNIYSTKVSNSAIIVSGMSSSGQIVILEAWSKKVSSERLVDKIFELYFKYPGMCKVGCEEFAMQKVLVHWIKDEEKRRDVYLPWRKLKLDPQHAKDARIRGLVPYFGSRRVHIGKDMTDFIMQYSQFPTGKVKDLLDALTYAQQFWVQPEDEKSAAYYAQEEEEMLMSMNPYTGY